MIYVMNTCCISNRGPQVWVEMTLHSVSSKEKICGFP